MNLWENIMRNDKKFTGSWFDFWIRSDIRPIFTGGMGMKFKLGNNLSNLTRGEKALIEDTPDFDVHISVNMKSPYFSTYITNLTDISLTPTKIYWKNIQTQIYMGTNTNSIVYALTKSYLTEGFKLTNVQFVNKNLGFLDKVFNGVYLHALIFCEFVHIEDSTKTQVVDLLVTTENHLDDNGNSILDVELSRKANLPLKTFRGLWLEHFSIFLRENVQELGNVNAMSRRNPFNGREPYKGKKSLIRCMILAGKGELHLPGSLFITKIRKDLEQKQNNLINKKLTLMKEGRTYIVNEFQRIKQDIYKMFANSHTKSIRDKHSHISNSNGINKRVLNSLTHSTVGGTPQHPISIFYTYSNKNLDNMVSKWVNTKRFQYV